MVTSIGFRSNVDNYEDFHTILKWCEENDSSFNTIINSLLPAIAYTIQNRMVEGRDGTYMRCEFGDVKLLITKQGRKASKTETEYLE